MERQIYEVIRDILDKDSTLTQKGLADKLDVNPAAVNRMLHGMRQIKADEIPLIEEYLGVRLNLTLKSVSENINAVRAIADVMRADNSDKVAAKLVPVYDDNFNIIDEVEKHPAQSFNNGAFAFYIQSEYMEPRYFFGELVYIQKGRPPEKNRDCFVDMKDGTCFLANFLNMNGVKVTLKQFNPEKVFEVDNSEVKSISAVVGRN